MWVKRSTAIVLLIATGLLLGFRTDALRSNWKYAGGALPGKESGQALTFYDAENIRYLDNGDVQVWMKAVDASEIDGLVAREKAILTRAAEKTAKSYYPPYFLSNPDPNAGTDAYIEMILWEEAANHAELKSRSRGLYEIRCRERMIQRISSMLFKTDGSTTYASDFDRWSPITPGSTGDAIQRLLCK